MELRDRITTGMTVKSGDGRRLGHIEDIGDEGIRLADGPVVPWEDVIELKDGELWVAAHRPELGERRQASPND